MNGWHRFASALFLMRAAAFTTCTIALLGARSVTSHVQHDARAPSSTAPSPYLRPLRMQEGLALLAKARDAENEILLTLAQMRRVAVSASSGSPSVAKRERFQSEFRSLLHELEDIAATATFQDMPLLTGERRSIGIARASDDREICLVRLPDASIESLGLRESDVDGARNANRAIAMIDVALDTVGSARRVLQSDWNRLLDGSRVAVRR